MKARKKNSLDFDIDKLTNSIENVVVTADYFFTEQEIVKRAKKKELDVDFIGDQQPLTKAEEKAISDYFAKQMGHKDQV